MSVIQQLRDSGLFDEYPRPKSGGNVRFEVTGWRSATIYANESEIHIWVRAFTAYVRGRFPSNDRLHELVCSRSHGYYRDPKGPNPAYKLRGEHVPEVIEIIRDGIRMEGSSSI